MRSEDLEAVVVTDDVRQLLGPGDVVADHRAGRADALGAQGEPQLERPEPTTERDLPVPVVDRRTGPGRLRLQVRRQDAQRPDERLTVGDPEQVAVEVDPHPLVRIGGVGVGAPEPVVDPPELLLQRRDARHRGVDVEPDAVRFGHVGDGVGRVERHRRGGPVGGTHEEGGETVGQVALDHPGEDVGPHREVLVVVDDAHPVRADAGDAEPLLDARVRLGGRVAHQLRRVAVDVGRPTGRPPPRREHRHQRGLARRPLDHAATGRAGRAEPFGQVEQLLHPVEHERLELGGGRRRGPRHRVDPEPGRHQLAEDRRERDVGREPGEEPRVLPLGEARHDDAFQVGHDRLERLGLGRGVFGQLRPDVARRHVGEDPPCAPGVGGVVDAAVPSGTGLRVVAGTVRRLDSRRVDSRTVDGLGGRGVQEVGDPVDHVVAVAAELVGCHPGLLLGAGVAWGAGGTGQRLGSTTIRPRT